MKKLCLAVFCSLFFVPAVFAQEVEPNDSMDLADSISALAINGTIGSDEDVDWFVLVGQEGYQPTFTIVHEEGNDFDFEIFSDGESVDSAVGVESGDSLTCSVPGRCHVKIWSCDGTGAYSLQIAPRGNSASGNTHEAEPNDTKDLADSVSDMTICGEIAHEGDVDWFALEGQEGYHPSFAITHDEANDFDFEIYSNEESVGMAVGVSSGDSIDCDVPGRCFVKVWGCNGTGAYSIAITPREDESASDEVEPNDTKNLADSIDDMTISGDISHGGDVDWFVLQGQEGCNPTFTITHDDANDFDFEVYNEDDSVGSAIGIESGDGIQCEVPGRCFVRVWSSTGTGAYQITIEE